MSLFAIASFQPNTLIIDKHGTYNMGSFDRATLAPTNEPPNNAYQRLLVPNDPPTGLETKKQNTETIPDKHDVEKVVSHENSRHKFR